MVNNKGERDRMELVGDEVDSLQRIMPEKCA